LIGLNIKIESNLNMIIGSYNKTIDRGNIDYYDIGYINIIKIFGKGDVIVLGFKGFILMGKSLIIDIK